MTSQLSRSLEEGSLDECMGLVYRRLLGAEFDVPPNRGLGERSIDYLIELLRSDSSNPSLRDKLTKAVSHLLEDRVIPKAQSSQMEGEEWSLALLELVGEIGAGSFSNQVSRLASSVAPHAASDSKLARAVFLETLRLTSGLKEEDARSIRSQALHRKALCARAVEVIADVDPISLFERKAGHLSEYLHTYALPKEKWKHLQQVVNLSASRARVIYDEQEFEAFIEAIAESAKIWSEDKRRVKLRHAFMRGLSLAGITSTHIKKVERAFWSYLKPDYGGSNDYQPERTELGGVLRRWLKEAPYEGEIGAPLCWNYLPFAENGYLRAFQIMVETFFGVDVEVDTKTPFEQVGRLLADKAGKITVAIHNNSMEKHFRAAPGEPELLRSCEPLFKFERYEMLFNRDRLQRELLGTAKSRHTELIVSMLDRSLRKVWKDDVEGLAYLFSKCKISVCRGTDMEQALIGFLEKMGVPNNQYERWLHDAQPDGGAADLLDGKVGFYVGGALQSHYLQNTFEDRIGLVNEIDYKLMEYMYIAKSEYKKAEKFYNKILLLWTQLERVWNGIKEPANMTEEVRELFYALEDDILSSVNGNNLGMAFVASFEELDTILQKHDNLISCKPDSCRFIPVDGDKITHDRGQGGQDISSKKGEHHMRKVV